MASIGTILAPASGIVAHSNAPPPARADVQSQAAQTAIQNGAATVVAISGGARGNRAPSRSENKVVDASFEKQQSKSAKKEQGAEGEQGVKKSVSVSA